MTDLDVVEAKVTVTYIKIQEQQKDDEVTVKNRVVYRTQSTGKFTSKQVDEEKIK